MSRHLRFEGGVLHHREAAVDPTMGGSGKPSQAKLREYEYSRVGISRDERKAKLSEILASLDTDEEGALPVSMVKVLFGKLLGLDGGRIPEEHPEVRELAEKPLEWVCDQLLTRVEKEQVERAHRLMFPQPSLPPRAPPPPPPALLESGNAAVGVVPGTKQGRESPRDGEAPVAPSKKGYRSTKGSEGQDSADRTQDNPSLTQQRVIDLEEELQLSQKKAADAADEVIFLRAELEVLKQGNASQQQSGTEAAAEATFLRHELELVKGHAGQLAEDLEFFQGKLDQAREDVRDVRVERDTLAEQNQALQRMENLRIPGNGSDSGQLQARSSGIAATIAADGRRRRFDKFGRPLDTEASKKQ